MNEQDPTENEPPWYADVVMPALLRHARTTYGAAMRAALDEAGCGDIPGNGLYVIGRIALGAEPVPLGDLVRELGVTKQAAGQLVDTLVLRGYVERAADTDDRRKLTVTLTERGRRAAEVQGAARDRVDAALIERVGPEAVAHARRALAALIELQRAARTPAS
jgi:DNA-binding MarR family transcriptional regulator